jgi:hypothetical protein|tara:strand:- start:2941 stop:4356 length:1416 start_codon:yes stop_codon:yes gene_type:complete
MKNFHIIFTSLVVAILFTSALYAKEKCQPNFTVPPPPKILSDVNTNSKKKPVYVFFDGSLSMLGYVVKRPPLENLFPDIIDQLTSAAEDLGSETLYHKFGKNIEMLDERGVEKMSEQGGYTCPDSNLQCEIDNKETRLDKVFNAITVDKDATYIVVTDLFMSSKDLVKTKRTKLQKPLKAILRQGKSIGILGVMNSFNGIIYDIPTDEGGTRTYANAQKRPFYVLIIGSSKNVNFIKNRLKQDALLEKQVEVDYKFSLITSNVISKNLNVSEYIKEENLINVNSGGEAFKLHYTDQGLPVFRFNISQGLKQIEFKFKNTDFIVPGSNDIAEYKFEEKFWSRRDVECEKGEVWKEAKINNFSKTEVNGTGIDKHLHVNIFGVKTIKDYKLRWGWRYFVVTNLYTAKIGTASVDAFKSWSLSKANADTFTNTEPKIFKTLNLLRIIKILNLVAEEEFKPTLVASIGLDFDLKK